LLILKKTAASKRAVLPRSADYTRAFLKDWQRLSHSGRYDMVRLKQAMLSLIANDMPLGPEWLDHNLKGDWIDHRECHIGGDFLLIYQADANCISFNDRAATARISLQSPIPLPNHRAWVRVFGLGENAM